MTTKECMTWHDGSMMVSNGFKVLVCYGPVFQRLFQVVKFRSRASEACLAVSNCVFSSDKLGVRRVPAYRSRLRRHLSLSYKDQERVGFQKRSETEVTLLSLQKFFWGFQSARQQRCYTKPGTSCQCSCKLANLRAVGVTRFHAFHVQPAAASKSSRISLYLPSGTPKTLKNRMSRDVSHLSHPRRHIM